MPDLLIQPEQDAVLRVRPGDPVPLIGSGSGARAVVAEVVTHLQHNTAFLNTIPWAVPLFEEGAMRIGVDGRKIPRAPEYGPLKSFDHGHELGMDGLFFRTVLEMSPTLDHGELREIKAHADALGMYCESGLGKVNPFATPEAPELRTAGDGDILLGFRRMLEACRAADITEVWIGTANYKAIYQGIWAYDRFRTDVTWDEQLVATERFLHKLAPIARDLGIHMNMETHEEITTFEVVRLVEAVGPDVMGVTFDIANVTHRGEDPVAAAHRVGPYTRQTHLKDIIHVLTAEGAYRQTRPCGQGVVDYETILPLLYQHNPALTLTIENPTSNGHSLMPIYDPRWHASHPDLSVAEFAEFIRGSQMCGEKIAAGAWATLNQYDAIAFDYDRQVWFIQESAAHLRTICEQNGLDEPTRDRRRATMRDQQQAVSDQLHPDDGACA